MHTIRRNPGIFFDLQSLEKNKNQLVNHYGLFPCRFLPPHPLVNPFTSSPFLLWCPPWLKVYMGSYQNCVMVQGAVQAAFVTMINKFVGNLVDLEAQDQAAVGFACFSPLEFFSVFFFFCLLARFLIVVFVQ